MSNYDLQKELNQYERELREAERYNNELRSELSAVENGVNNAQKKLEDYNDRIRGTLDRCNSAMTSSHQKVIEAIEIQGEIERLYTKFKQVELANKKIRAANNAKYYDFANYRTVRKIVQGIMDNLEVNMVSDKTITKSVEVQHLQTPDYWLTCVLISIMAWKNDDRELAERAMARAIKLDKKNSSIFYMLFNLRMARDDASLKWFYTYQECELKGSDQRTFLMLFSLVSKTLVDNVKDSTKTAVYSYIKQVIASNMKTSGYSEDDVIGQIRQYFNRMQPSDQLDYAMLRKHCLEFDNMSVIMMQAKNNINILEYLLCIINVPVEQKNAFIKGYIEELISAPNQSEIDVYDEISYNELVIRYEGDVDIARETFAAEKAKKADSLNLIAEMINWIYERDTQEVNGQIKLNMFTLTKFLHEKAVESHVNDYRSRRKINHKVTIGDYSTEVNFKREDEEYGKITSYYTSKRDEVIASIKKWKAFIGFGLGVAAIAGAFFAGYWLFAIALICVGYGVSVLVSNQSRINQLCQECAQSIKNTSEILQNLFSEFKKYQAELDEYDTYYDKIKNEFSKI